MFHLVPFLDIGTMLPFFQSSRRVIQHANTDYITTMSFVKVKFADNPFIDIILC